jgi:predicted porin
MKTSILAFAVIGGWAVCASAQNTDTPATFTRERGVRAEFGRPVPAPRFVSPYSPLASYLGPFSPGRQYSLAYLALADMADPNEGGSAGSAANAISGGRQGQGLHFYRSPVRGVSAGGGFTDEIIGDIAHRAWGMSIGIGFGRFTLRVAHQNRHVAKVQLYDLAGNSLEAKNSLIAANVKFGWGTTYAAYSISRGWGAPPLFNPDNPYGAGLASIPSTDSRDVLLGVAVPVGRSLTLLASAIHRNDRNPANRDANQFAIGASYAVSRRTDFYAAYSHTQNLGGPGIALGSAARPTDNALNIGLRHAF